MPKIFDFGGREVERSITVAGLRALRRAGRRVAQVTAETADEAAAAEAAGIEMVVCRAANVARVREGSRRVFVTAALGFADAVTGDEILRTAFSAITSGADAVITGRGFDTVRMLANERIPVMGHLGFVPRKSTWVGGIRAVGKTTAEAVELWDQFRRLEDAGAFAVECEIIPAALMAEIFGWWQDNAAAGRASVLYCYAFGKAQRILNGLLRHAGAALAMPGPIVAHGAMMTLNHAYARAGVALPPTMTTVDLPARSPALRRALVVAPPSAQRSTWLRRFGEASDAFASGWMQLRGTRRRRGVDRGFALSDHADWPGLLSAIAATGAQRVIVTHGNVPVMVRYLCEQGLDAQGFRTEFGDDDDATGAAADLPTADTPAGTSAA